MTYVLTRGGPVPIRSSHASGSQPSQDVSFNHSGGGPSPDKCLSGDCEHYHHPTSCDSSSGSPTGTVCGRSSLSLTHKHTHTRARSRSLFERETPNQPSCVPLFPSLSRSHSRFLKKPYDLRLELTFGERAVLHRVVTCGVLRFAWVTGVQGYLAHKKSPPPRTTVGP